MTFILSAPLTATEGTEYEFTITPTAALAADTMIRWQIVPKGALPVTSSDFPSLTGMLSFTSGATTAQTVAFTPTDDARREISKDFELRIYDAADMASEPTALDTQVVTLRDNDDAAGTYGNELLTGNGDANIIGFGTAHGVTANGSAGSDFYVISRFQYGNVEITDTVGTNLVKFDAGVTITDYDEESADGFVKVISRVDLTLSTGAVITIINPVGKFVFQLGSDPIITTYDEFKGEIRAEGSNETSTLRNNEAFQVLTATTDPDISGNSLSAQFSPSFGSASVDVFSSASTSGFSQNGSAGDDFYVISRFQYGNVEITDTVGTNLIKFDVGVTITDYDEESADGFVKVISRVALTLSTGAVITIINPVGKFVFQLGDDDVIATYAEFKGEIRAEGSNETSTLRNNEAFSIPIPSAEVANTAPIITQTGGTMVTVVGETVTPGHAAQTNVNVNGVDATDGVFSYTGLVSYDSSSDEVHVFMSSSSTEPNRAYLPDGRVIDIPTARFAASVPASDNPYIWLEQDADGNWQLGTGVAFPSEDNTFYALAQWDNNEDRTLRFGDVAFQTPFTHEYTSFRFDSEENQDVAVSMDALTATDTTPNGLTWSLGGVDAALFEIDSVTGEITWIEEPDYETLNSADGDKDFQLTAIVKDGGNFEDSIALTVTLTDGNDAPVIINVLEDFTGQRDVFLNGENAHDGVFHYTGTVRTPFGGTVYTQDIVIYLADGTILEVPDLSVRTNYEYPEFWVARVDDDSNPNTPAVWQFFESGTSTFPPDGRFYHLGFYDLDGTRKFAPNGTSVTDGTIVVGVDGTVAADGSLAIDSAENQNTVVTLSATDLDGDTLTWELTGGADMNRFAIDRDTGAITWVTSPEFDTRDSADSDKQFQVTATVRDTVGSDEIALTVTLVENTDPVIGTVIEGFTGWRDVFVNGDNDTDGTFHYTGRVVISGGLVFVVNVDIYLDDGTVIDIPNVRVASNFVDGEYWLELGDHDSNPNTDDTWQVFSAETSTFPTTGTYYHLGHYDGSARRFEPTGTALTLETLILEIPALAFESFENQNMVVDMLPAVDETPNGFTWSLEDATSSTADARLFNINSETGAITWKTAPEFDTQMSAAMNKEFQVTVTVTDGGDATDSVDVTITLLENTTAPVLTHIIEDFTGWKDVATDGYPSFHHTVEMAVHSLRSVSIREGTVYLPDGTIVEIAEQNNYRTFGDTFIWLEQANDGTWQIGSGASLPAPSAEIYIFGQYIPTGAIQTGYFDYVGTRVTTPEPLEIELGSAFAINLVENEDAVITLTAPDTTPNGLTWALSGVDMSHFDISTTGEITWKSTPDYEDDVNFQSVGGDKNFIVTATATDGGGLFDTTTITVTLTDVFETAPVITGAIEGFTGQMNAFANGRNADDGIFHFTGTITALNASSGLITISDDAQAYLPDGSVVDIPSSHTVTEEFTNEYQVWLEDRDGDGTWTLNSHESTPENYEVYNIGEYNFYPGTGEAIFTPTGTAVTDASFDSPLGDTLAVDSDEGQDEVVTLFATDRTPNGQTWVLSGRDEASFEISDTGVITWDETPNFDSTVSLDATNTKVFNIIATVTDDGGEMDTIDLTVTLIDVV